MRFLTRWRWACCALACFTATVHGQLVRPTGPFSTEGLVRAQRGGRLTVTDRAGAAWQLYLVGKSGRVMLSNGRPYSARPTKITVAGSLPPAALEPGMPIRIDGYLNEKRGTITIPVNQVYWVDEAGHQPDVKTLPKKKDERGNMPCRVLGHVDRLTRDRLSVKVPRSRYAKKGQLTVRLTPEAKVTVQSTSLAQVREGARVTKAIGFELSTGDRIVQELEIRIRPEAETAAGKPARRTVDTQREADARFDALSDEIVAPRIVRSQHYVLQTDISDRDAQILLDKLETMLTMLMRYYGRPQPVPIECYVVHDLKSWDDGRLPDLARQKIAQKEGFTKSITQSNSRGRRTVATVYACSDMGVVQHEAVHAYCRTVFGEVGPLWYAEGMAEMGQYWRESQQAVDVSPRVIKFFRKNTPPSLKTLLSADSIEGDTWEAYNWRWGLCHMLAHNPNYSRKFKSLGLALMNPARKANFATAYRSAAKQLVFEYNLFFANVDNGYRVDLCAWDWKHKFEQVTAPRTITVEARSGWQGAVPLEADVVYSFTAEGDWQIDGTGTRCSADGLPAEKRVGQLVGVVMREYELQEVLQLGANGEIKVPNAGQLYLRCDEPWSRISDNSGTIRVEFSRAK